MSARAAVLALAAALALSACARTGAAPGTPSSAGLERIDYETGPCFGACPVYKVSVYPGGKGVFTGIRNTAVVGERVFTVTPAQYAAFAKELAPYRPAIGDKLYQPGTPACQQVATDLPSVDVRWTGMGRQLRRLYFYFGCDIEKNARMAEALGNAVEVLPLEPLIGPRP